MSEQKRKIYPHNFIALSDDCPLKGVLNAHINLKIKSLITTYNINNGKMI